eukprot:scaffold723_cov363-Prasinococcus_capsulatus_cf.AAC.10
MGHNIAPQAHVVHEHKGVIADVQQASERASCCNEAAVGGRKVRPSREENASTISYGVARHTGLVQNETRL